MPESTPIRVLLVDDHPVVRMGLRAMLSEEPDLEVVGEAADGAQAVVQHRSVRPDVTLMDLRMPGGGGVDAIGAIRDETPGARIIVVSTYDSDEEVFRAIQAGARGYLLKGEFRQALVEAIRSVHAGGRFIPQHIASRMAERMTAPGLSAREVQVLELVAKGLSNKEIGGALSLSQDTIKTHLKRIYDKLDVTDRTEAAFAAAQRGLIRLS